MYVVNQERSLNQEAKNSKYHIINIFLIYSPLHYLAAENIAADFESNSRNFLFYLKPEFIELVDPSKWDAVEFLPWPRFYPENGMFGRIRRTRKNLAVVEKVCAGAKEIRLHTPVIDTEAINYFINFIRFSHRDAQFCVRLIPDGLLNIQRYPMGLVKRTLQYFKKIRRFIYPSLNYYTFSGDRTGSDTKIVDRIYILPGFPNEYDTAKTVEVSLLRVNSRAYGGIPAEVANKRALVVGQDLVSCKVFSEQDMSSLTLGVRSFIEACGINNIAYKSHHRDRLDELFHPDYIKLVLDRPLETYLGSNHYELVISIVSTALLTARIILPDSCRVVAYGMNMLKHRSDRDKKNLESIFIALGVEMVNHNDGIL